MGKMNENSYGLEMPEDVRGFLGLGRRAEPPDGAPADSPSFAAGTDEFDFETAADRRARFMASSRMLFATDVSRLDNPGAAALYQSVTEGMFGLRDENGSLAFGKRASSDPHENINMLRRFVKGEYSLIEDPEYTTWRQMDEEAKFRYAMEHEGWMNKAKSDLKGERGSSILEKIALMGTSSAPGFQLPDETRKDIIRRSNYENLNDEEKAKYRADVIGDYEEKLSRRQTLATFLQYSQGLSDRARYLLAKSFSEGRIDENVMLMNDKSERDRVLSAFSLMRGDQKKGRFLGIEMDFTDDTWANRLQLGLYGLQQSVVGLVTDTADIIQDAAIWTYAKTALDESERKQFFEAWDANVRAEQAMQQSLPEADSFGGEMFQGVMENLHWIIPYGAITKGGKMMKAARGIKEEQGFFKSIGTALTPMRLGGDLKKQKAVAEAGKAAAEAGAAAKTAAWTLDVNGTKKLGEMGKALVAREMAAVDRYTQMLRSIDADLKAAKWWKDAAGAGMWAAGEASAFSAFASEYIANADAAGISREDSVLTAAFVGAINAAVERLYVPGLESSLSPAKLKSMMWSSALRAIRSDGAAGFRKWFSNRVRLGTTVGLKVAATEGFVEEPLQQIVQEHAKAFDAMCGELRENGQATAANEWKAFWDSVAKTLPNDYATFIDTAIDMLPSSVGFGLTEVGRQKRAQHFHNVLTRHANRRAGATAKDTMLSLDQRGEDPSKAFDYDAGLVDMIQQAVNVRNAVDRHWRDAGKEDKNPHRFEEAVTAARRAWRSPKTRDAVQEIADAAQVDVKTAEVLAQYFQTEAESTAFSPQARAWSSLNMSLADIDETTIRTVLPGYVEGSFASDPENGVYSGRVKMGDGTERTIAYRVGDLSAELMAEAQKMAKEDSSFGKSFDARHAEIGDGVTWASLSEAQRYAEAVRSQASVNGFSTGKSGVFELTDSRGEKVRVNADDVIYLANGRIGDIGYGPAATQGTVRHETFHSLWRFIRGTLADADVQQLAKTLGVDVTKDGWEVELDERMAHEMERYASGHYVSHAVSSKFDALMRGWAGKAVDFFGKFGPSDEVTDPKTGKPYQMKGLYDSILRGELGSGALGVELRKVPAQPAPQNSPDGRTASGQSTLPVAVTDAERATAEAEAQAEAAATEPPAPEQPVPPVSPAATTVPAATSENPADAATPNQVYYRVGLPNSQVKLVGRLEVRDASTGVITSTDADYHDRGNQNRDDKSEESRALVEKIGANPDPLQIGTVQPIASNGIVWALPNGDVIIGNHRVNGVRLGYEKGTAGDLEKFVREDAAKRGIEIGADVKKPLTVFVLERIESPDGKADVHEVVRLANESQNRGFNIREQAGNDAKILQDNNLLPRMEFRADGRIDETKSGDAIGKFRQESGAQGLVAEDGSLTEEGQTRLTNAALAVLLGGEGNNALLNKIMTNAGRLGMQSELRALMKMTPELMALAEAKPAYDLRAPLAEALQLFTEWRDRDETARVEKGKTRHDWREMKNGRRVRGLSWEAYLSQGDMFRTPSDEAKILGDLFAKAESLRSFDREDVESEAGKKRVIDLISGYLADYIANARAVNTDTEDMFGGTPASRAEVMAAQRATGGENGAARFSIGAEEAQRQYDEVVARYTNEDGTKRRGWMKAPNGKPTRLSERQWVQVRTPAFKAWFGDWEAAANRKALGWYDVADVSSITGMEPKTVPDVRPVPDKAAMVELFKSFGEVKNAHDGRVVRFPTKSAGKMIYKKNVAHAFKTLFESSIRAFSEKETLFEGHKSHPNVRAYHHYINKFKTAAGTFYIRFAVRDDHNGSNVHNAEISDIEIYNENGATQFGNQTDGKLHPADGKMPFTDIKITYFLAGVNGENAISSKVVDENGEPLVVWHGDMDPSFPVFDKGKIQRGTGFWFAKEEGEAASYALDAEPRAFYLNIRNPAREADLKGKLLDDYHANGGAGASWKAFIWDKHAAEFLRSRGYDGLEFEGKYIAFEPTQIKSATDNTGAFAAANPDIRYSIGGVFTGSAADYANRSRQGGVDDGPSLLKVGTGEGSQVYGWGLYGSTVRGVAEGYARGGVGSGRIRINGEEVDAGSNTAEERVARRFGWQTIKGRVPTREQVLEDTKTELSDRRKQLAEGGSDNVRQWVHELEEDVALLENRNKTIEWVSPGNVYEQTFFTDRAPGDESHLLKWYDAISDANWDRVIAQAEKEGLRDKLKGAWWLRFNGDLEHFITDNGNSGDAIYERLSKLLGGPQAASEFLARAGIDGVKYPVDSYGGKGVKDGDEAGWNYVSFRDDNIRVDHKWTDGQQRYSIATLGKYNTDDLRDLAHRVKDGDSAAIADAGRRLAKILPKNAVLVPMPSRTGEPTTMRALADAIAADADGWRPMAEAAALSPASVRPAAEGRRYSVSAPLVEAMQDRERRENAPRAPQGESPFFAEAEGAVEIPIRALRTVKDEPERSIMSAAFRMRRAAAGRIPKRAPVSVVDNGGGVFTVIDGNATTWAAARGGLESVRAKIIGKDRGTHLANSHYLVGEDKSGCDADGKLHTHGLDGLSGEAAREKAYEQASENAPRLKVVVDAAAKAVGGEALHRKSVKKRQRVDEKAASYGNDYSRVVDLIGGTIILDPSQDMADALKAIRKNLPHGASVAQVKKLSSPDENGYWDIKVSVRFANGGIGEIIIVDRNINDAKFNRGGHDLYDFERALEEELKRGANGNSQVESLYKALRDLEEAIYSHKTEKADRYQAAEWDLTKASASDSVTHLMPGITDALSEEFIGLLKELLSGSHLQRPASLASQATPARSFIQNDISDSSLLGKINNGIISNSPLKVNSENEIDANLPRFSVAAPRSGLVYPQLRSMSDDELLSAAVAVRMALGKSEKFSDKVVKVNTVQNMMRRLHPDWDNSRIGLETYRVLSDARKFGKRIREDLDRGVSDSLILEHLPQAAREQFGLEMRQEARKGQSLGAFGQKVASEIEERQVRVVEDAVRVQTGLDAGAIENTFGINLSETIMHLAANPLKEEGKDTTPGATGEGVSEDGQAELGQEEPPAAIDAKVKSVVDDIVAASKTSAEADERNRAERRATAARDAETQAVENGDDGSVPAGEPAGEGDDLAAACAKEALNLENPRHLARFVAELARRQWIKEHGLAKDADVWRDLVAVQFLRKTAQSVYAKLCRDLVYSRSRETAMQRIAKFDNVPTVAGLLSEMEFVGALINAQRIRDTQKQMCEKLDLFLKESFGAQGRFRPDKEEGKRKVSAEAELRARYMRHAMWLTPTAAAEEARQLQETLDALSVDFKDAGRDRDQSREFVETIRKLNVLREFGALRYKPVGEIEAAAQWWDDFARGESDDIVREMSDRDIRTKKAAHLLAVAFADPKRTTIREGGKADALNRFITGHMGFISLLQDCMRHASDADAAAVKDIIDYISREVQKSGDRSEAEKRRHNDAFHAAVESIYGKSFNSVMKDMMAPDERFTKYMGVVGGKRVTPTKGRALQLLVSLLQEGRKVQVEDEDNPGQTKTVWEGGYHDNIVKHHREGQAAEIMRLLDPADMNMLKWLGAWYENNRSDLSGVCHSLFGIGVYAELPNYFPVKMMLETQGLEKGQGVGWTIFPKALTPRVRNERDFDTSADIFSMWASRMEEAAQWKHHAQLGLEMRGIFGRAELREAVRANHGASVDELMQGFITDILAGHGAYDRSTAGVQYFSDQIRGWTALCALGGNIGVMFKQPTSIPAFGFEIGLVNTAKYMVSAFTPEGMAAMRRIWNSEQRRTRWQVGSSEAVRNALNQQGAGALKRMFQASMITNKLGDAVPALVVGQGIYRDCLARGMSEEDAMAETWSLVERTQQSGRMENQTSIQRRNKLGRIMFQFLSTQQQYLQYEVRAIREVIARPDSVKRWGNLGRAILLNHFILTSAYYWMGQLYKYALGQEPPEDELKDWIVTCLLGPYGSLFVAGFCCKYTLERAIKGYSIKGGSSMLPMESWLKNQVNDGAKLLEAIFDSDGDTWDNMLEAAGRWMSDSNSTVRDLRKIYRYRIEGEPQKKR